MSREYSEIELEIIKKAEKKALRLLDISPRTEKNLREKLEENEFPDYAVEEAVAYVKSFHYVDDARYAELFILSRKKEKSRFEIRHSLSDRGVDSETIEKSMEEQEWDESDTVRSVFLKKYRFKDLSDQKNYEKAFRYFAGRGFLYEDIKKGIASAIREMNDPD